jgi:GPH family glycoside/pentoside/hexuronide:cation symporter
MSNKLGWAVGTMFAGWILAMTGFRANVMQNAEVLAGLKSMMSIIPAVPGVIALILLIFFYKLDEPAMERIKSEIGARREAAGLTTN